jgi:ribonuclease M5
MNEKLNLKEAVIVEGRYDRIRLSELIASPIIETGGFRIFKDKEKQNLIRSIAARRGILVMTDVDSAGFVIRNFLRGIINIDCIKHAYIPTVEGKERRKPQPSKEGVLGVEGIDREALIRAIRQSGATIIGESVVQKNELTKSDFYDYGLIGREYSAQIRESILADLGLPRYLSTNAMVAAMNCLFTKEEFESYLSDKKQAAAE